MESLRSSLIAAERSVLASAPSRNGSDARRRAAKFKIGVTAVIAVLFVTNVVTWRALTGEREVRVAAEQRAVAESKSYLLPSTASGSTFRLLTNRAAVASPMPLAAAGATGSPPSGSTVVALNGTQFAKKLSDPAAREALRDQQKGMALQLYAELLKRWHLSGPAAAPILDALADHQVRQLSTALVPGSGAGYPAQDANAADNDAVRAALNAKQLRELRAYDETLPDRIAIQPLLSELELAQTPLSSDAVEELIDIMHDERLAVPQPSLPANPEAGDAYMKSVNDWQAGLDERILDRGKLILSSDALARLQNFQETQRKASAVFASITPNNAELSH